jgi:outer membrane protein assembly factor BamB
MWCKMKPSVLLASLAVFVTISVNAQNVTVPGGPLAAPIPLWETQIMATLSPGVSSGNGAYLTPDELHVITTSAGGTLSAFDAASGAAIWEYDPPAVGTSLVTCHSGVTFANASYIIYTIIDDENAIESFS